ncbi:hypothetical protein SDC9_205133 [bioreactor metagenome]|uniref:Uncharacterized protein n=1 Tax=bioreactor metagenome TaxID=1076179 RepID=A0A645J422_9ZZZZ
MNGPLRDMDAPNPSVMPPLHDPELDKAAAFVDPGLELGVDLLRDRGDIGLVALRRGFPSDAGATFFPVFVEVPV